jgi:Anaerobic dehydrogenases, typically selenocysteine-containing
VDPTRLDLLPKGIQGGVQAGAQTLEKRFSVREAHVRRSGVPCTSDNRGVKTPSNALMFSQFADPRKALPALLGKSTTIADLWLPVRINDDLAAMKGIMLAVEEKNPGSVFDRSFIESY